MFCSKCGAKNEKDAKFCTECGETLNAKESAKKEVKTSSVSDAGGIRKTMKKDAKGKVNGALIGATAVYLLVCVAIGAIFGSSTSTFNSESFNISYSAGSIISEILVGLLGIVFTFGLFRAGFNAVRSKGFEFGDIFTKPFEKMKFLGYIVLLCVILFAIIIVTGMLMIIPILGFFVAIAFVVALIYYLPAIEVFMILLADPNIDDISFDGAIKRTLEIVKGNRVEYYGITFSFIGWILLAFITFGILFIWLTPYMTITMVNAYRKWTGEESFTNDESGLSNGAVIGFTVGGCGCGCLVVSVLFVGAIAAIIAAVGIDSNNPSIQSFIDKYVPAQDKVEIESDFNDAINDFYSEYNS